MNEARFDDLLGRLLDDRLTTKELSELVLLARDDSGRQAVLQVQLEAADLIAQAEDELRQCPLFVAATLDRVAEDPFVASVRNAIAEPDRNRGREQLAARWPWAFAAALVVALVGSAMLWRPRTEPERAQSAESEIVRITSIHGSIQWTGNGGRVDAALAVSQSLGGGTLESQSTDSWAVLQYRDGSTVTVSGPSVVTFSEGDQKEVHLRRGRLSAKVVPQPVGTRMLIHTPTAKLEVLGTQFNLDAEPSATTLNVNEGRVRLTRLVDGSVTDVPAEHQTVATINQNVALKVTRRHAPTSIWRSQFPRDVRYGQWQTAPGDPTGSLRATSLLLTCARPKPLLLFLTAATNAAKDAPPMLLTSSGRFQVEGRLDSSTEVHFGLTMNHPRGGFAGKYVAIRKFEIVDVSRSFEWEIPLKDFKPLEPTFPATPVGLELVDCWCLTVHEDHGLRIRAIELQSDQP